MRHPAAGTSSLSAYDQAEWDNRPFKVPPKTSREEFDAQCRARAIELMGELQRDELTVSAYDHETPDLVELASK